MAFNLLNQLGGVQGREAAPGWRKLSRRALNNEHFITTSCIMQWKIRQDSRLSATGQKTFEMDKLSSFGKEM
ncbi:MAG: hypothetical protein IJA83_05775 [Clostridia bacterium]|nr:hypothetical protein [Clostridia bacterium]